MTRPTLSDQTTTGRAGRTASIIVFPARPKPVAAALAPDDQLARALESLNAALSDQRAAVLAWREVLGELKAVMTGLDDSLRRYRSNLRTLGISVASLHAKARALEAWADTSLP